MSYYIRILSATTDAPTAADLCAAAEREGHPPTGFRGAEPKDAAWRAIDLEYDGDRCPLRLERALAPEPGALPDVARFEVQIGSPGRSRARKKVLESLSQTRQIITIQVPDHVIDDEDWGMVHALLGFLHQWLDGLIQADGEGFYDDSGKLLLALE